MSARVPGTAKLLGAAGLIPFLVGAATGVFPVSVAILDSGLPLRFVHPFVLVDYGIVILSFMTGVFWGFAAQARATTASVGYVLSVIPALYVFFVVMTSGGPGYYLVTLALGFAALLPIDNFFHAQKLAPEWWMRLRIPLTGVVLACLAIGWMTL